MWYFVIQIFLILIYLGIELDLSKGYLVITIVSAVGAVLWSIADFMEKRYDNDS